MADSWTEKTRPASSVCLHWVCPRHWASAWRCTELCYRRHLVRACGQSSQARLAQSAERKALNLVVVGSSPTVGVSQHWASSWQVRHAARPLSHVLADSCTEKTRPASSVCPHWVCPQHWASACLCTELGYKRHIVRACGQSSQARLAQSAERKALNLVVVGSSPTVGVPSSLGDCMASTACSKAAEPRLGRVLHR